MNDEPGIGRTFVVVCFRDEAVVGIYGPFGSKKNAGEFVALGADGLTAQEVHELMLPGVREVVA